MCQSALGTIDNLKINCYITYRTVVFGEGDKMTQKRDYYDVLGINRNADEAMIKKAYRKLAKKYHPDTNAGNKAAEQKFKEVTEAYDVLGDPEKKKLYDRFGHSAFDGSAQTYGGSASGSGFRGFDGNGGYREFHFESGNMEDIFGDIFGDMFRGGAGRREKGFRDGFGGQTFRMRGSDIQSDVSLRFEEAVFGCEKMIRIQKEDGSVQSLKVHIPAGIDTGKSIRLRGKGMPGQGGAEAGDLLLRVNVEKKPGFERKGMDVYSSVRIPFATAALGGEAVVQTLTGNVVCNIRKGTQSGTKIRLKGKGIVSMKDPSVYGDQYVTVQIEVPENLSPEAEQKLREFDAVCKKRGSEKHHAA